MNTHTAFLVRLIFIAQVVIVNAQTPSIGGRDATLEVLMVGDGNNATQVLLARPMEVPIAKQQHYIDCRDHLLYFVHLDELRAETQGALAKAKEQAGGDEQALMLNLATSKFQRAAFTVDLSMALLNQLALLPRRAPADCDATDLSVNSSNHCFVEYCKTLDPSKDAIHLFIRGMPAPEIEVMREVADTLGIEISTRMLGPEDIAKFELNE